MKWIVGLVAVVLVSVVGVGLCEGRTIPGGHYFGQTPPGFTPVVFAPGIISQSSRFEWCLVFSRNLDECVFGITNPSWSGFNLLYTKMGSDSTWSDPVGAPFQGNGDGFFPFFAADDSGIYFVSSRPSYPPTRIWQSSRVGAGWSEPTALGPPIYSGSNEWGSSFADDGTLYFSSDRAGGFGGGDIYRATTSPDGEVTVENLGAVINTTESEGSACIAPDGSYLIFEATRPNGYGQSDLYISYNTGGIWSTPRNLGPAINTSQIEDGPFISSDGKYMFFNRRRAFYTTERSDIWWVDARAALDPGQSDVGDSDTGIGGPSVLRSEPNPFGSSTTITYATPASGYVAIKVHDILGREVRSLVNASRPAGTYSVKFEAPRDERSVGGIYFCTLHVDDRKLDTMKIVSLR